MGENDSFLPTFKACLKLYIDLKLFTPHLFFTIISQTLNEWMGSFKHHVLFFCFFSFLHRQYNHSPPCCTCAPLMYLKSFLLSILMRCDG